MSQSTSTLSSSFSDTLTISEGIIKHHSKQQSELSESTTQVAFKLLNESNLKQIRRSKSLENFNEQPADSQPVPIAPSIKIAKAIPKSQTVELDEVKKKEIQGLLEKEANNQFPGRAARINMLHVSKGKRHAMAPVKSSQELQIKLNVKEEIETCQKLLLEVQSFLSLMDDISHKISKPEILDPLTNLKTNLHVTLQKGYVDLQTALSNCFPDEEFRKKCKVIDRCLKELNGKIFEFSDLMEKLELILDSPDVTIAQKTDNKSLQKEPFLQALKRFNAQNEKILKKRLESFRDNIFSYREETEQTFVSIERYFTLIAALSTAYIKSFYYEPLLIMQKGKPVSIPKTGRFLNELDKEGSAVMTMVARESTQYTDLFVKLKECFDFIITTKKAFNSQALVTEEIIPALCEKMLDALKQINTATNQSAGRTSNRASIYIDRDEN